MQRAAPAPPMALHTMPRPAGKFCLAVERFLRCELAVPLQRTLVVVAYSGGADSTALLYVMRALAPRLGYSVAMAHVNHRLRPEAGEEYEAARRLAQHWNMPFFGRIVDVAEVAASSRCGLEEAGRIARLTFFSDLQHDRIPAELWGTAHIPPSAVGHRIITMGHHLNDLAEDVVMRLVRGTGWPALGGMCAWDASRGILRPLLYQSRADIEQFNKMLSLTWVHDRMNNDMQYFRNRIRAYILPLLLQENPQFLQHTADLHRIAQWDASLFNDLLAPALLHYDPEQHTPEATLGEPTQLTEHSSLHRSLSTIALPAQYLHTMPIALRLRAYKVCLDRLGPGQALMRNLLALDTAWQKKHTGTTFQFPRGKQAVIHRKNITFSTTRT